MSVYYKEDFTQELQEYALDLERAGYEKESYEQIINFMVNNNQIDTEGYGKMWARYVFANVDFSNKREIFQNKVVKTLEPNFKRWNYSYAKGELTIEV